LSGREIGKSDERRGKNEMTTAILFLEFFYPSLAFLAAIVYWKQAQFLNLSRCYKWYEMGKRHGLQQAAMEVWKLSEELRRSGEIRTKGKEND
jgi:hypothetical protein